jgi:hypothetical protein
MSGMATRHRSERRHEMKKSTITVSRTVKTSRTASERFVETIFWRRWMSPMTREVISPVGWREKNRADWSRILP